MTWLAAFSALCVGMAAPQALAVALLVTVIVLIWSRLFVLLDKWPQDRWLIPVPLTRKTFVLRPSMLIFSLALLTVIAPKMALDLRSVNETVWTLGVSYVTIKAVSAVIDSYYERVPLSASRVILLHLFFPIYSSGPIENLKTFRDEVFGMKFNAAFILYGLRRILIGIFKSYFLGAQLVQAYVEARFGGIASAPQDFAAWEVLVFLLLNFLGVYINFSGYTDIAVGSARLFGIKVSENFRLPFLATNIQDFWARWHLSLGRFINEYLYMRLTVLLRRPYLPLFIAFIVVGLWHKISFGYLLWGIGHGGALVAYLYFRRALKNKQWHQILARNPAYKALAWFLTMSYVSLLSYLANASSPTAAGKLLRAAFI